MNRKTKYPWAWALTPCWHGTWFVDSNSKTALTPAGSSALAERRMCWPTLAGRAGWGGTLSLKEQLSHPYLSLQKYSKCSNHPPPKKVLQYAQKHVPICCFLCCGAMLGHTVCWNELRWSIKPKVVLCCHFVATCCQWTIDAEVNWGVSLDKSRALPPSYGLPAGINLYGTFQFFFADIRVASPQVFQI